MKENENNLSKSLTGKETTSSLDIYFKLYPGRLFKDHRQCGHFWKECILEGGRTLKKIKITRSQF